MKGRNAEFVATTEAELVATLRTRDHDRILRLVKHSPDNFSIPRGASEKFTHIEITMFAGTNLDTKRALYVEIAKRLEPFGVPSDYIKIVLIEVQPVDVGVWGGGAACDLAIGIRYRHLATNSGSISRARIHILQHRVSRHRIEMI